jgi:hypothetical protein
MMKKDLFIPQNQIKGWFILALLGVAYYLIISYFTSPLNVLFVTVCLGIGIVIFIKPWIGTYILIVSFPFIASMPRGLFIPGFKIDEILIILVLVLHFISPNKNKNLKLNRIDSIFIMFLLSGFILSTLGMVLRGWDVNLLEFGTLFKPYFIFRLLLFTIDDIKKIRKVVILLLLPIFLVSLLAIMQILNLGNVRAQLASVYSDTPTTVLLNEALTASQLSLRLRATSTLGHWNALGGYSALVAFLSLAFIPHGRALRLSWLPALAFTASVVSLILTGSSNSLVGFSIGLVLWWFLQGKNYFIKSNPITRKMIFLSFLFILIVVSVGYATIGKSIIHTQIARQSVAHIYDRATLEYYPTYGIPSSLVVRWYLAKYLIGQMLDDDWALLTGFGIGPATNALLPWGSAESGYMHMLFYFGPLFLLFYFLLLRAILLALRKYKSRVKEDDIFGNGLATAGIIFVVLMGILNIVQSAYIGAGVMHLFWIVIGFSFTFTVVPGKQERLHQESLSI